MEVEESKQTPFYRMDFVWRQSIIMKDIDFYAAVVAPVGINHSCL